MKHSLLLLSFLFFIHTRSSAQIPGIQWQHTYGGCDGFDQAQSVAQTPDGGYILTGYTTSDDCGVSGAHFTNPSTSVSDAWVLRLSASGTQLWQRCLGGRFVSTTGLSIRPTADSGYITAGYINDNVSLYISVTRLDDTGAIVWSRNYGATGSNSMAHSIRQVPGGYILAGQADSAYSTAAGSTAHGGQDALVTMLDDTGGVVWQHTYGGSRDDVATAISITRDSGYILAGATRSADGDVTGYHTTGTSTAQDIWVVKISPTGTLQWQKTLGGTQTDLAADILQAADGSYLVLGSVTSSDGDVTGYHTGPGANPDYWLARLDGTGALTWAKTYGGTSNDVPTALLPAADGGYLLSGTTNSANGDVTGLHNTTGSSDYWLVKTDAAGSLQWQKTLGGSTYETAYAADRTSDGGYVIAGYGGSRDGDLTGDSSGGYWVVRLSGITGTTDIHSAAALTVYPNPAGMMLSIDADAALTGAVYILTDLAGRQVLSGTISDTHTQVPLAGIASGAYLLQVGDTGQVYKVIRQ